MPVGRRHATHQAKVVGVARHALFKGSPAKLVTPLRKHEISRGGSSSHFTAVLTKLQDLASSANPFLGFFSDLPTPKDAANPLLTGIPRHLKPMRLAIIHGSICSDL